MVRRVARDKAKACATLRRSLDISATCALSTATSVPAPMAIPTSAAASAGASLMPSPTKATGPALASSRSAATLPSGRWPAKISSIPIFAAMARAVASRSPVIKATRRPSARKSAIAAAASGRGGSEKANRPAAWPSTAMKKQDAPCPASASAFAAKASVATPSEASRSAEPTATFAPPTSPVTPNPGR